MNADFPQERTAFIFSDPAGKRWPRLRLALLFSGIAAFLAAVFFVQTLFVIPQLRLPFALRQLRGQLKSLQKKNPAGQLPPNVPALAEIRGYAGGGQKTALSIRGDAQRRPL